MDRIHLVILCAGAASLYAALLCVGSPHKDESRATGRYAILGAGLILVGLFA